ncbi:MAG: helix-turn-helix domain-containing protein [Candidatus Omnitrophica bacterium]|nr:helix-turn-helix domain-containing protein [Candidatus Omnitrophota bacterium]
MIQKRLINADELSQMIDIKRDTIYRWVSQRRIPCVKIGRSTKFDIDAINKWIKEASIECKDYA